jgi:hypothetical protein
MAYHGVVVCCFRPFEGLFQIVSRPGASGASGIAFRLRNKDVGDDDALRAWFVDIIRLILA